MAATPWKVIISFRAFSNKWREVWYRQADGMPAALSGLDATFAGVAVAFRHPATFVKSITVQDLTQPRVSRMVRFSPTVGPGGTDTPDVCSVSAVYEVWAASLDAKRFVQLRGLKDNSVERNNTTGSDVPTAGILAGVSSYLTSCASLGFSIQQKTPVNSTSPLKYRNVVAITVGAAGEVTITADSAVDFSGGLNAEFSLFDQKDWPGLNGKFEVSDPSGTTFKIGYKARKPAGVYVVTRGRYRTVVYRYRTITAAAPTGFLHFGDRQTFDMDFFGRGRRTRKSLRYQ